MKQQAFSNILLGCAVLIAHSPTFAGFVYKVPAPGVVAAAGAPAIPNACTLPWGGTLPSGESVPAYSSQNGTEAALCSTVTTTATCSNGVLSPAGVFQTCADHDQYAGAVVAALHFEGANGSTGIVNSVGGLTATAVNSAQLSTAGAIAGSSSLALDGSQGYSSGRVELSGPAIPATGAFTVEGWIKANSVSASRVIVSQYTRTSSAGANYTGRFNLSIYGGQLYFSSPATGEMYGGAIPTGAWVHVALVRNPATGMMSLYKAGQRVSTLAVASSAALSQMPTWLGMTNNSSYPDAFSGNLDDFRFTYAARYTGSSYTPPPTPFLND